MSKLVLHGFVTIWRRPKEIIDPGSIGYRPVARKIETSPWKQWFAWRPVKIHGKRKWLTTVYRRCINTYVDHDNWKRYEYGTIFDVITGE